jgi:hypothetical protein
MFNRTDAVLDSLINKTAIAVYFFLPMPHIVLSCYQINDALEARRSKRASVVISPDLNRTKVEAVLNADGIVFPGGQSLTWLDAEQIASSENRCFVLEQNSVQKIQTYSEVTHWVRSLYPSRLAPTMMVSGTAMHRINGIDPYRDTLMKIKTIAPVRGRVLDTATGLGYTAIEASRSAEHVVTVELDPASLEIARYNPWSQALFDNPKIDQVVGDVFDVIAGFDDHSFSCIIHDPPMFSLAGELYSTEFYQHLFRVLRDRGRVFHYIGDLSSKSGQSVVKGAARRLQDAGFSKVQRKPHAFGVVAYK